MECGKYWGKLTVSVFLTVFVMVANAAVIESQTISVNTTWPDIGEVYEINGTVTVATGATLTIAPGAELAFATSALLTVNGTLLAQGDVSNPIQFHRLDSAVAWSGIQFSSSSSNSLIKYARIKGASTCVSIAGSDHVITASVISECSNDGIRFNSATNISVTNNLVLQNATGLYISSGTPQIENNLIVENGTQGIYIASGSIPHIRYNTIDLNGSYGVYFYLPSTQLIFENNLVTRNSTGLSRPVDHTSYDFQLAYNNVWGNGTDYGLMSAADTDISSDPQYLSPYLGDRRLEDNSPSKTASSTGAELGSYGNGGNLAVYTDIYEFSTTPTTEGSLTQHERWSGEVILTGSVTVARPYQLQIEPGTVIKMPIGASIIVNSTLSAVGTFAAPIIFEAANNAGEWGGITFASGALGSVIQHAYISGANNCIDISGSVHVINRNIIRGCNTGIYIRSGTPQIENNLIVENGTQGIYIARGSIPHIRYNTIDLNGSYGVYFYLPSTQLIFENNLVTRNSTGLSRPVDHTSYDFQLAYNNVWGNGTDYGLMSAADTDISSDPQYLLPYQGDRRIEDESPTKTASSTGTELGAYGNGGNLAVYTDIYDFSITPTTEGSLTQHERWSGEVILTGSVTVARPYQLQIEPGTVIKMPAGASIIVNSTLSAVGTFAAPIIFEAANNAGEWGGIKFASGALGSVIQHAYISGAHNCIDISGSVHVINRNIIRGCNTGIYIRSGTPQIENNLIVENGTQGIYIANGSIPHIRYNTIDLNGSYGVYFYLPSTQLIFENNLVTRNSTGLSRPVDHTSYDFQLAYNNVWGNGTDYGLMSAADTDISSDPQYLLPYQGDRRIEDESPTKTASSTGTELGAYGNGGNLAVYTDIYDFSTTPTTEGSLTQHERWSGEVVLTGSVTVARPYQLQIEPGTVIKMPTGASIIVNSSLNAVGTFAAPIIFESLNNGSQWGGLKFKSGSIGSVIQHAKISGASNCMDIYASIYVKNNIINGCNTGVYIHSGVPNVENNLIVDNVTQGIYVASASIPRIRYNTIDTNGNYGVYFYYPSTQGVFENNLVTNNLAGLYRPQNSSSYDFTQNFNNVWGNTSDYINMVAATTDISSDPEYIDNDRHLALGSASKTASSEALELGAYGGNTILPIPTIDPVSSPTANATIQLSGNKTAGTGISINGKVVVVANEQTTWLAQIALQEGNNLLTIYTVDSEGFRSESVRVVVTRDSTSPLISSSLPANGSSVSGPLSLVRLSIADNAGTIDYNQALATARLSSSIQGIIAGTWIQSSSDILFQADVALAIDTYTASLTLSDSLGNSALVSVFFTVIDGSELPVSAPVISNVSFDGTALIEGQTIIRAGTISLNANDNNGISRVEFSLDGTLFASDSIGSNSFSSLWDIVKNTDGAHQLQISAFDTLGNQSTEVINVNINLAVPVVPVINIPQQGLLTNQATVTVFGTAEKGSEVVLFNNGLQVLGPLVLDANQQYSGVIPIQAGLNALQAAAQNRGGQSILSTAVEVTVDTTIPVTPTNLTAITRESGIIRLIWNAAQAIDIAGYQLYRSSTAFDDVAQATQVNSQLLTANSFDDFPGFDGQYFYAVISVSNAGTLSALSNVSSSFADATPPRALSISYAPTGAFDAATGRMAAGAVDVVVNVSEVLLETPFLTITADGGTPIPVLLKKVTETEYSGTFNIVDETLTGTAYAVFSARDQYGNRGTEIDSGATIEIDTDGPKVIRLDVSPNDPIKNDPTVAVIQVEIELDAAVAIGSTPALEYQLSAPARAIQSLPLINTANTNIWTASFELPVDAGLNEPEILTLSVIAEDDLANPSIAMAGGNRFQVYQGDLQPLDPPAGLTAQLLSDGRVQLNWLVIDDAIDYQLFRAPPGEVDLSAYLRTGSVLEIIDQTAIDGLYRYAIASVRHANNQEAVSAYGEIVEITVDATAPDAPTDLSLVLTGSGIRADWQAPIDSDELSYRLYRSDVEINTVEGLLAIESNISKLNGLDISPSDNAHYYSVTAVDASGNESVPSTSVYLNFSLLPVSGLLVSQTDQELPVLNWNSSGNTNDYLVYLVVEGSEIKLTDPALIEASYLDTGFADNQRQYAVSQIDSEGVEGPKRLVLLPNIAIVPPENGLQRGIMNSLDYQVSNLGKQTLSGVSITATIGNHQHRSETFTLLAGETKNIAVIFGGYADLADGSQLLSILEVKADTGEKAQLIRNTEVVVTEGTLAINLLTADFTRGATGQVRFSLFNNSAVEVEIVTAIGNGAVDSDQVRFLLTDEDGNVLATQALRQVLAENARTLADGRTVITIAAGKSFTSQAIDMPVPLASPDHIYIEGFIDQYHYHLAENEAVSIAGVQTRRAIQLIDVAYQGSISDISPKSSFGDEDIVITGQALEMGSDAPISWAPLKLIITVNGFERISDVVSDRDGNFSYRFKPLPGESGYYQVAVIHPDIQDRPIQSEFTIGRVFTDLSQINLNMPKNFDQEIPIKLTTGEGIAASNVQIVYEAADQPLGELAAGINIVLPTAIDLQTAETATVTLTVRADNIAENSGVLVLGVKSTEGGTQTLTKIRVDYTLSEALPVLSFTPSFLETGVAFNDSATETITLQNRGLADLLNTQLELLNPDDSTAPGWVFISTPEQIETLAIGESYPVSVTSSPTATVTEGLHEFKLRISSDNAVTVDVNLYIAVTQSGIGNVKFHLSDIYTATLDTEGNPILGMEGAEIRVQNEVVLDIDQTLTTNQAGEVLFSDLPSGRYKFKAKAENHQEVIGRFRIKPGVTTEQEVFLDYNLVTVEWDVTEITLEDRYEITLNSVFETDVPAPVVIMEPASINLPKMQAGEVHYGEFTMINYGLIRAEALDFQVPVDDAFRIELLGGLPTTIEAKERITVPYRIVALKTLDQGDEGGSGAGDCYARKIRVIVGYRYQCINGDIRQSAIYHDAYFTYGKCSLPQIYGGIGAGYGGGGGYGGYSGYGGGGGGSGSINAGIGGSSGNLPIPRAKPKPLDDKQCIPNADPDEDPCNKDPVVEPKTGSSVHTVMREYQDQKIDLQVKILGGEAKIQRRFYDNAWHWGHDSTRLKLTKDNFTGLVISIDRGRVIYSPTVFGSDDYFKNEDFQIVRDGDQFLWESSNGNWERYDSKGRSLAKGNKTSVLQQLVYTDDLVVQPSGMLDRMGNQIFWFEYDVDNNLIAVQDNAARRVEYGYNTAGLLTSVTDVLSNEFTYQYDEKDRMIQKTDALGRSFNITYSVNGDVASVINDEGRASYFEFGYDKAKKERLAQITTASGKLTEAWYNDDGDVLRVMVNGRLTRIEEEDGRTDISTDEKGNVTRVTRDQWEKVTRVVYPDGTETKFEYENRFHQVKKQTNQRGIITLFSYDQKGNLTQRIEAVGTAAERTLNYSYDSNNQLLEITLVADAVTAEALTSLTYDGNGNIATLIDPEANKTEFLAYDVVGNPLRIKDARGNEWTFTYNVKGQITSKTDPQDNKTAYEYDAVDNRVAVIDANNQRFELAYNQRNQVIRATDPLGHFSRISYNTDGLPTLLTDAEGRIFSNEYDNEQRLQSTQVGSIDNGYKTSFQYDESNAVFADSDTPIQIDYPTYSQRFYYDRLQRQVRETDVLDQTTEQSTGRTFDSVGNIITETDEDGRVTQYQYDALNRLVQLTNTASGVISYQYDNRGNLLVLTDQNGASTRFEYDRNNRVTKETRPMGEVTVYQYDAVGNRTVVIDAKGQLISFQYNSLNLMQQEQHFSANDLINPIKTIGYSYDKLNRLTGYDDGISSAIYSYDALGQKTATSTNYGSFTLTTAYSYYANGLKESFTNADGETYHYFYDDANRLTVVELPGGQRVTYSAYQWSRPNRKTLPGGSTTNYSYDALQRVTEIDSKDPIDTTIMQYQYQRSAVGNITDKLTEHGDYQYQYDSLDRLTDATNPVMADESYTYDELGNRKTAAGVTGEWNYDLNNRLLDYADKTFVYDDNGNMVSKVSDNSEQYYLYDIKNRLIRVEGANNSVIAEYYYDPFGRRLWKQMSGIRTYFTYADEGLVGEFDAAGALIKSYGYNPGTLWTTDPLFQLIDGEYYWYQNDHLATSQKIVNSNGVVVWSGKQEAFGTIIVGVTEIVNNLRFPGQYFDEETGLNYNFQRHYYSNIGLYLQVDPFQFGGGDIRAYGYVSNNPLIRIDPFGTVDYGRAGRSALSGFGKVVSGLGKAVGASLLKIPKGATAGIGFLAATTPKEKAAFFLGEFAKTPAGRQLLNDLFGLLPCDLQEAIDLANGIGSAVNDSKKLTNSPLKFIKDKVIGKALNAVDNAGTDLARSGGNDLGQAFLDFRSAFGALKD